MAKFLVACTMLMFFAGCAVNLSTAPEKEVLVIDEGLKESLIFYLPFDEDIQPAKAAGDSAGEVVGEISLVEGRYGMAGSFSDGAHMIFDAEGNFDQAEGTIAMWIKPYWPNNDGEPHCFFEVPGPGEHATNPDAAFVVSKGWTSDNTPNLFYFHSSTSNYIWGQHVGGFEFNFLPNEWVHITATWSASDSFLRLYANGQYVLDNRMTQGTKPPSIGRQMFIGSRYSGRYGADAAIDELMIFDRPLNVEEIAVLAGLEAPPEVTERRLHESSHVLDLEMGWETPHVAFNNPSANEPIKPLFVVAGIGGRDVVELAQRYEMDFSHVIVYRENSFGFDTHYQNRWENITTEHKIAEMSAQLDENPDVLVISNFDYAKIPAVLRQRIDTMVRGGMGMVLVNPSNPPMEGMNGFPEGRREIISGVPLSALVDLYPEENLPVTRLAEKVVQPYTHGNGRVVVLRWYDRLGGYEDGIGPRSANHIVDRQFMHRYNYYLSLVGKAMDWSMRRDMLARWTNLPSDGQVLEPASWPENGFTVEIEWHGPEGTEGFVESVIRDKAGRVKNTYRKPLVLSQGINSLQLMNNIPPAGTNYIDISLETDSGFAAWGTTSFKLQRAEEIVELDTGETYYTREDILRGHIRLRSALPEDSQLFVRATDTYGREYARQYIDMQAGSSHSGFSLPLAYTSSLANYIEAEIIRDGQVLSRDATIIFIPKPKDSDFLAMMWAPEVFPHTMVGYWVNERIREAGFNTNYRFTWSGGVMHDAMSDLSPVQILVRFIVRHPPQPGWMNLQSLHLAQNYGITDPDHSLANPVIQEVLRERIASQARHSVNFGPWWYGIGTENFYRGEFGFSPYGLEYFHGFLERRYGTIDNLNYQYGTSYTTFEEVPRQSGDGPSIPALLDNRMGMEDEWAALHGFVADEIRKIDPGARVGADSSDAGDLERILEELDVWGPYSAVAATLRSLGPEKLRSHWWGSYDNGPPHAGLLWNWLLQGRINFHQFWVAEGMGTEGIFNRNLTYRGFFKNILSDLKEVHSGLGLLLSDIEFTGDRDIVIHYSRPSYHAGHGPGMVVRAEASEGRIFNQLTNKGHDFRYASERLILDNYLVNPAAKILFMPASYCLSEIEAEKIREFVYGGGTLVADVMPGILNEYGRLMPHGLLDDVFGATTSGETEMARLDNVSIEEDLWGHTVSFSTGVNSADSALTVTSGRAMGHSNGIPVMVVNEHGNGRTILLNFDMARMSVEMSSSLMDSLIAIAEVKKEYRLTGVSEPVVTTGSGGGARLVHNTVSPSIRGDVKFVGVVLPSEEVDPAPNVSWDEPMHTYNVRTGEYLGRINSVTFTPLPPTEHGVSAQVHMLSLHNQPMGGITITSEPSARRGEVIEIDIEVDLGGADPEDRLLRVEIIDPEGNNLDNMRRFITLETYKATCEIPFAYNDVSGEWKIRVTDLSTGITGEMAVNLM